MGERLRLGFIGLTAVVVALAIASAILSAAGPKPSQSMVLSTPSTSPSPSPSPSPTFTLQPPTPTAAPTATPTATAERAPTFTSYVVQLGNTLSSIAHKFGVTVQAILAANPSIPDAAHLKAGQTILIPPPEWAPSPSSS
jgi:LysM repeat protein